MNGAARAIDRFPAYPVDDAISLAAYGGIEQSRFVCDRQVQPATLDAHVAAPHRVTLDFASIRNDACLARKAERAAPGVEVPFEFCGWRQQIAATSHLDDALLAFALCHARRGDTHAGSPRNGKERLS